MPDELIRYCWSRDGEHFDAEEFPTREAAAEAGREEMADDEETGEVHTGRAVRLRAADVMPDAEFLLERIRDNMYERVGEYADDWLRELPPEVEVDLERRLAACLTAWADEHKLQPTFFAVEDIQP